MAKKITVTLTIAPKGGRSCTIDKGGDSVSFNDIDVSDRMNVVNTLMDYRDYFLIKMNMEG